MRAKTRVEIPLSSPLPLKSKTIQNVEVVETPMLASKIYGGGIDPTPW